jgi:hypothetical protein
LTPQIAVSIESAGGAAGDSPAACAGALDHPADPSQVISAVVVPPLQLPGLRAETPGVQADVFQAPFQGSAGLQAVPDRGPEDAK